MRLQSRNIFKSCLCIYACVVAMFAEDAYSLGENVNGASEEMSRLVDLTLKPLAETSASELYLEEVAECSGEAQVCENLLGIKILSVIVPGTNIQIESSTIKELIRQEMPEIEVTFKGSGFTNVIGTSHVISSQDLQDHLKNRFAEISHGWERTRFVVKRVKLLEHVLSRDTDFQIIIPALDGGMQDAIRAVADSAGGWLLLDASLQDQDWAQNFRLQAQVDVEFLTPIASRTIEGGELIAAGDLASRWQKANRYNLTDNIQPKDLIGKTLSRRVNANEIIKKSYVKKPIAVARGQIIKLRLGQAGVSLSSDAKALQSGSIGETVEVEIVATKKKLHAQIIEPGIVEGNF